MRDANDKAASAASPILVVPYMWIGDFVRCHTVIRLLRERFPGRSIDVLTTRMVAPLVDYMPGVRSGIVFDLPRKRLALGRQRALAALLRARHYGDACPLPRRHSEPHRLCRRNAVWAHQRSALGRKNTAPDGRSVRRAGNAE